MIKAAAERYFEKIVECITDVAFLTLKKQGIKLPDDDTIVFTRLVESNVIENSLAESLRKAKSMRNRIAHQYADLDDNILFDALQNQLLSDAKEFAKQIRANTKK